MRNLFLLGTLNIILFSSRNWGRNDYLHNIHKNFPVVLVIMLQGVWMFDFVDEIRNCGRSNESYWAVLSRLLQGIQDFLGFGITGTGFQYFSLELTFRIPIVCGFRIQKSKIPDSRGKNFPHFGIRRGRGQPRPQGAFPWLWSQGKPEDEV